MSIGKINWPKDKKEAVNLYLRFLIKIAKAEGITFEENNPIVDAANYIDGNMSASDYLSKRDYWWAVIDSNDWGREFSNPDALKARYALSLLSVTEDQYGDLGEHLSWFIELVEYTSIDVDKVIDELFHYFNIE